MKRKLAGISVFIALFATVLVSQNCQASATLTGTITDQTGAAIASAPLSLRAVATGVNFNTASGPAGQYTFAVLNAGAYELTVSVTGFKTFKTQVELRDATTTRRDVVLEVGSMSETVTITSDATLLKTESGTVVVNGQPSSSMQINQAGRQGQAGQAKGGSAMPMAPPPAMLPRLAISGGVAGGYGLNQDAFDRRFPNIRGNARGIPGSEEYGHFVENEFVTPSAEPLSTFAVDVDTASYSNVRRFLNEGRLPPAESVRIEELINYFSYDYPLPEKGKPVSMTTNIVRSPWNSQRLLLHVGMRTLPIAAEDLPPSKLTFLVDVSGSMNSPDKLPLVKQALQMLTRQLRSQDSVSLVVYAGNSGVVLPPTSGSQQDRILEAVGRLEAGGSTNGAGGIRLAYQMARQSFSRAANNRVILATDGDFNVGVQSDEELVRLIEEERKSGVFLSVLGFGTGNLKDSKMEKLADHGNGTYAYIDSFAEARKVFVQEMGATLVTVAKDVKLQIEFNPARVKEYRLVGYENRLLRPEDFNNDAKDAGDLGAGHQVTAFYEIIPTGSADGGGSVDALRYQDRQRPQTRGNPSNTNPNEWAWVKLRHKLPQSDVSQLLQWPVAGGVQDFRSASRDVRFAAAVAEYGMLLRHSKFATNASFDDVMNTASQAIGSDLNGYRTDFLDLVRKAGSLSGITFSRR
ncbi:MAG: von Willebrand factor type A domain-containing protein [Acidobacteriota bacterium]